VAMPTTTFDDEYARFTHEAWPDPRPFLDRLRAAHPVYRTPLGYWFVTGHACADRIYKDRERWSRRPGTLARSHPLISRPGGTSTFFSENLLALDGAEHQRMRGVLNRVFTPNGIGALQDTIQGAVDRLLDGVQAQGGMDVVEAFARPLPTAVILDIFAIEDAEYPRFLEVAHTIMECFESLGSVEYASDLIERADRVIGSCADYLREVAEERRGGDGVDLLSQLVRAQDAEPDRLSDSEFASLLMHLVAAGFETTAGTVANGLYALLTHPDQLELLRARPELARGAVEEILRYEPGVVVSAPMYALVDHEIEGELVRKGDQLLISSHGCNHDPSVFDDPRRFDITRRPNRQIAFGRGQHACVGAALARLEMQLSYEAIVARLPAIALAHDEDWQPEWKRSHVLRQFRSMDVRW
jgi:cytochrome P450